MYKIVKREELAADVVRLDIEAPAIAKKRRPGQFVILCADETAERIPLTIANSEPEKGTITVIFQEIGMSTHKLGAFAEGDELAHVVGPLGVPTHIENFGTCVCIGGGIGTAVAWPIARGLKEAGNEVISIVGARTKSLLILEEEMKAVSSELYITTDDGSYGLYGFVTDKLLELVNEGRAIDLVLAIGPVPMMRAVCELTRPEKIKPQVSLNPIMVDGTGMCGACRASVGGTTRFVCVEGPEFDGHEVDFIELTQRLRAYQTEEKLAIDRWRDEHQCQCGGGGQ